MSRTNNSCRLANVSTIAATHPPSAPGSTPITLATSGPTASDDVNGASSHSHAPCRNRGCASAANCSASRVLPTPPTPVSVTIRADVDRLADAAQLGLAPDELGHLRRQVPRQRVDRLQRREARVQLRVHELEHPLRARQVTQPVLTQLHQLDTIPQLSRARSAVAWETTIWPPCATPINRAARFTDEPK